MTFFEHLESNGFFTSTWLEQREDGAWGLWPDYEGNRGYQDEEEKFVLWLGDDNNLREVAKLCALVGVTRASIQYKHLVIEPNDGGHTSVQIRYADKPAQVEKEGFRFLGLRCGTDCGKYAVIWYMGSLMGMLAASYGKFDEWQKEHKRKRCSHFAVPGDNDYDSKPEHYSLDPFEWKFEGATEDEDVVTIECHHESAKENSYVCPACGQLIGDPPVRDE